jgi:hypothetical protein
MFAFRIALLLALSLVCSRATNALRSRPAVLGAYWPPTALVIQSRGGGGGTDKEENDSDSPDKVTEQVEEAVVNVAQKPHRKSNAVGDPDGDGSDDDDDEDDDIDELDELSLTLGRTESPVVDTIAVRMEMDLLNEPEAPNRADVDSKPAETDGGVGVRFGRMNRRRGGGLWRTREGDEGAKAILQPSQLREQKIQTWLREAWQSHVYLPPSKAAWSYLVERSRMWDGAARNRLDRRTLYGGLLLEWAASSADSTSDQMPTYRKYFDPSTSQSLLAALSLASQPQWRDVFPQSTGIRLYGDEPDRGCPLAMQETVALALVRPLF